MNASAGEAVVIAGVGAVCAVGNGIRQVDASVRAGLGAQATSSIMNRWFEPMTLALFPDEALEPLAASLDSFSWTAAQRRMLRLAGPALREAIVALPEGATAKLFLGLPEPPARATPLGERDVAQAVVAQAGSPALPLDIQPLAWGRAAALGALQAAAQSLAARQVEWAIVGGVDTYLDLARLGALDAAGRLLGPRVMDGFIPGEGAAFLLLTCSRVARSHHIDAKVEVVGVGTASDPGHLYGTEPARGEGLSEAIAALAQTLPSHAPIQHVYAGLNGENFGAKEWGVARIRHARRFAPGATIEHPADCHGDAGAATGALLMALAERALRRGQSGPMLVWSSSDHEPCACALLNTLT
ncbi:MAG TPA: beta-ketoacyl synthase N-terminal-like domain-containing protein [Polyangiaceae bacterium]|nr:beta-ketoacyl synthase N-terminal-like domain-containing protein [Polyangiaceae bacterium]